MSLASKHDGGSHLFRNPSLFSILTQDARTAGMLGDPRLLQAVVALQSKPELYDQFLRQDARLSTVLEVLLDRSEKPSGLPSPLAAHRPTEYLWQLVRNGSEDEIRTALRPLGQRPPVFRDVGPRGLTLLMEVASRKRRGETLVAQMIAQGASVHEHGQNNRTALHYAAASGNIGGMKALIEAGADVSARDENEATPLDLALASNNEESAAMLIDAMERSTRLAPHVAAAIHQSNDSPQPPRASAGSPKASIATSVPFVLPFPPSISPPPSSHTQPLLIAGLPSHSSSPSAARSSTPSSASVSVPTSAVSSPVPTHVKASSTTCTSALTTSLLPGATTGPKSDDELVMQLVGLEESVVALTALVAERDRRIATMEEELLCSVCLERPVNTVLLECGHTVLCTQCAKLKICPICNKPVSRVVKTFRA